MALVLTGTLTFSATKVILTNTTGDYNASTNPGGYGAPNPTFASLAHYAIIRKKNVNSVADSVMVLDSFNQLSALSFSATRTVDGWYEGKILDITIWAAGTYPTDTVRYHSAVVYKANTSTSATPGADGTWTVVSDLTTIEANATITVKSIGRVTVYNADVYWSTKMAEKTQLGFAGIALNDRDKKRYDLMYDNLQEALTADQLGNNTDGEWVVLRLRAQGAV